MQDAALMYEVALGPACQMEKEIGNTECRTEFSWRSAEMLIERARRLLLFDEQ